MKFFNITQNKNIVLNSLILLIVFIFSFKIYLKQANLVTILSETKSVESNVNQVLNSIIELDKTANAYTQFVNKKDLGSVLNTLTSIAKSSNVKINSVKPLEFIDYPLYLQYPYSITVKTDSFDHIGKFLSKLESHSDVYIITNANIRTEIISDSSGEESEILILDLIVNTIFFKSQK